MRKSIIGEEQIVAIVKEAEAGVDVAALSHKHGISRATLYQWRSKYAGATVHELKRIKKLEAETSYCRCDSHVDRRSSGSRFYECARRT